jgi:hypothetical protein
VAGKPALAVVAALVWTSLAAASASPVAPGPGAVVATSSPQFTWTVPEGETTTDAFIASGRRTGAGGAFLPRIVVDSQVFSNAETRWMPTRPLFAGRYWWQVRTRDAAGTQLHSAPRAFTVRASGRITALRLTRYTQSHHLFVSVRWRSNARTSAVTLRVRRGGRLVWSARLPKTSFAVGTEEIGLTTWPSRLAGGTRVTLTATLKAGSYVKTLKRPVRSP